ncbi:MAG: PepSY domain-containing protein [Deltaproteobacteria bacterium]|nr:PepSY domain-containing protein [Deltaproteobacteria bacterium]
MTRTTYAAMLAGLLSLTLVTAPRAMDAGRSHILAPQEIVRQLEDAGYKNVHDVELDDGVYEADATSRAGVPVDLEIDPLTGRVLREDVDR